MKCFVASALGKDDVDLIYDKAICPVLKELKIKPFRVDRVEHNEDIDDQIFKLIDSADLCIADLTYARPSVYYEAGYAFGKGMPVVYIARSDHFKAKDKDPLGNLKVHFDLQMKNIISWTAPNKTFMDKLRSRIRHVIKPIIRARKIDEKRIAHEKKFSALPQNRQLLELVRKGKNILFSKGYRFKKGYKDYGHYLILNRENQYVFITAVPSISKSLFDGIYRMTKRIEDGVGDGKIRTLILFASLGSARKTTLSSGLSNFTPITNRLFILKPPYGFSDHPVTVGIIDGVKSVEGFVENLKDMIKQTGF